MTGQEIFFEMAKAVGIIVIVTVATCSIVAAGVTVVSKIMEG